MELQTAWKVVFNSMAFSGENMTLVDVKAVSDGYPLRGELEIADQPFGQGYVAEGLPAAGEAWVASQLFQALQLDIGDSIEVGNSSFKVTKVVTYEPDVGFSVFTDSPNVIIRHSQLEETGLIQPGSRVRFNVLMAGEPGAIDAY